MLLGSGITTAGIFFDDGEDWLHQRRFALRELRDFGFGRRLDEFESVVSEEVQDVLDVIRSDVISGRSSTVPDLFYKLMVGNMVVLLTGQRVFGKDRELLQVRTSEMRNFRSILVFPKNSF